MHDWFHAQFIDVETEPPRGLTIPRRSGQNSSLAPHLGGLNKPIIHLGFPGGSDGKESAHSMGEIPERREWLPTPVLLPGKSHGQRSLAGYSPWGFREVDMTKQLTHKKHTQISFS